MLARLDSRQGKPMKKLRSSTVEPVFGSLLNYFGLRRSNAPGKMAAHKKMLMAATAYNLKKYLAFNGGPQAKVRALTMMARQKFLSVLHKHWYLRDYFPKAFPLVLCNSHRPFISCFYAYWPQRLQRLCASPKVASVSLL
jgi:hypothetical protein